MDNNLDERLDKIAELLEHTMLLFAAFVTSFQQIGETFRQTSENFSRIAERMNQQADAIDGLVAAITPDVRRAYVAGALRALECAGVSSHDTALVLDRMLITVEEVNDDTIRNLSQE